MLFSPQTHAYGSLARHRLDIYRPRTGNLPAPVVVFFYGGAWKNGHRSYYRPLGRAFAGAGYVCVVADYRLYPEVCFPRFNEDAAQAIHWVRQNIEASGGDPGRIAVIGHSAGAHIGATIALDPSYLKAHDLEPDTIKAFAGIAGPYSADLTTYDTTSAIFGSTTDKEATRPIKLIERGGSAPPMLLLHGERDRTVYVQNSTNLANAVNAHGGTAATAIYPTLGHIDILFALAPAFRWRAPVWKDLLAFLSRL